MSSFPLTINGTVFSNATLSGKRYARNFPDLLQAMATHAALGSWHTATMVTTKRYFPRLGSTQFYVTPHRSFHPGMFVYAVSQTLLGVLTPYLYGTVTSYTPRTGLLVVQVEGHSNGCLAAGTVTFYGNAQKYHVNQSGTLAIANGGTASSTLAGALSTLEVPYPPTEAAHSYDDFIGYVGNGSAWTELSKVGTASYTQDVSAGYIEYETRAGFLELSVAAVSDNVTLSKTIGLHTAGGNFSYATSVYLPDLSSAGQRFLFQIGLKGANSSATSIFSYSGLGFSYQDDVNGGRWLLHYGKDGSMSTADSAVAAAADTWTKLEIRWNGTNVIFYIEGAAVGTFSVGIPNTAANNVCLQAMQLTKSVGTTARTAIIDYVYTQKKVTR